MDPGTNKPAGDQTVPFDGNLKRVTHADVTLQRYNNGTLLERWGLSSGNQHWASWDYKQRI